MSSKEYIWALEHKETHEYYTENNRVFSYPSRAGARKAAKGKRFKGQYKPSKVFILNQTKELEKDDKYWDDWFSSVYVIPQPQAWEYASNKDDGVRGDRFPLAPIKQEGVLYDTNYLLGDPYWEDAAMKRQFERCKEQMTCYNAKPKQNLKCRKSLNFGYKAHQAPTLHHQHAKR